MVGGGTAASEPRMGKQESPRGLRGRTAPTAYLPTSVSNEKGEGEQETAVRREMCWASSLLHRRSRQEMHCRVGGRMAPAVYLTMSAS